MPSKLWVPGAVAVVLAVAACGSSSSTSSSTSSTAVSTPSATGTSTSPAKKPHKHRSHAAAAKLPSRRYVVRLTGKAETPPGAPKGAGAAVIALHGSTSKLCWRFSHLHGFTHATFAHIHQGQKGNSGNVVVPLSTGSRFLHHGCVSASPTLIKAIEKHPGDYYVNIHSTKYPGGAVRSQL